REENPVGPPHAGTGRPESTSAWSTPPLSSEDCRTSTSLTSSHGGIADPEGFEPSTAGLEIRCPIRARRRVRSRARNANTNNPSTCGFGNRHVEPPHIGSRPPSPRCAETVRVYLTDVRARGGGKIVRTSK